MTLLNQPRHGRARYDVGDGWVGLEVNEGIEKTIVLDILVLGRHVPPAVSAGRARLDPEPGDDLVARVEDEHVHLRNARGRLGGEETLTVEAGDAPVLACWTL